MGFTIICQWIGESVTMSRYICQLLTRHSVSCLSSFLNIPNSPQPLFIVDVVLSVDNLVKQGVLSLGPSSASNVRSCAKSSKGNTPLSCIFKQNTTTPNFLTVVLSQTADDSVFRVISFLANGLEVPQLGQLMIG